MREKNLSMTSGEASAMYLLFLGTMCICKAGQSFPCHLYSQNQLNLQQYLQLNQGIIERNGGEKNVGRTGEERHGNALNDVMNAANKAEKERGVE